MTSSEIIADIRNISTSGSNPVEFKIEDSQILFWCNEVRSMLISQALQRRQDISDVWVQAITCLQLEQADISECCSIQTGCYVLRSTVQLPETIETGGDNMILRVVTPTGRIIPKTNPFENMYAKYNKFTGNKSGWYIKNRYLYVTDTQLLETINVYGIFENPLELSTFVSCDGNTCFSYDDNYPCSLKMANDITNIVLKTKVFPFLQLPADNRNDAANIPDTTLNTKGL